MMGEKWGDIIFNHKVKNTGFSRAIVADMCALYRPFLFLFRTSLRPLDQLISLTIADYKIDWIAN